MKPLSRRDFLSRTGLVLGAGVGAELLTACSADGSPAARPSASPTTSLAPSHDAGYTSAGTQITPPPSAPASAEAAGATPLLFPAGFRWGAATSAYQIEGAARTDGKGPSVWDTFAHRPGTITDGSNGDVAADHYHRWASDVDLMASLGLQSYRFSVSWPRVLPSGRGAVDTKGLDLYQRLVDRLLARNIKPVVTLWHWDTPQALEDKGGWVDRDTASAFGEYAAVMAKALGDRVDLWLTLNEPKTVVQVGYLYGSHAPGFRDPVKAYTAAHHLLLGHGLATQAIRAAVPSAKVGAALNLTPVYGSDAAAQTSPAVTLRDGYENRLYLDPIFKGSYPADVLEDLGRQVPGFAKLVKPGDLAVIKTKVDVLGVNYYNPTVVDAGGHDVTKYPTSQATWEQIYPEGLYDLLTQVRKRYGDVPISITENGIPTRQKPDATGTVPDQDRIAYVHDHLVALHKAIADGVPVRSYHLWSLMDNFEWAEGYTQRWGMVYVDFTSQKRTPKASAHWYAGVIKANAAT